MYKSEYHISGMTCQGCVNSIKKKFSSDDRIISSEIDLSSSNLKLQSTVDLKPENLNNIIRDLKKYRISYKNISSPGISNKIKISSENTTNSYSLQFTYPTPLLKLVQREGIGGLITPNTDEVTNSDLDDEIPF